MIKTKNKLIFLMTFLSGMKLQSTSNVPKAEPENNVQSCIKGCLMCSSKNECILCDIQNNYFLNAKGVCQQTKISNCPKNSSKGCTQCEVGYAVRDGSCFKLTQDLKIENCLEYYIDESLYIWCTACEPHFYLQDGSCVKVSNQIENCTEYAAKGERCVNCSQGVPDLNFKKCDKAPESLKNCHKYSFFSCRECNSSYLIDMNFLFRKVNYLSEMTVELKQSVESFVQNYSALGNVMSASFCSLVQDENCEEALDIFSCKKCKDGYFVNEKNFCQLYPEERIDNCEIYQSKTVCVQCFEGYWKKNQQECVEVIEIAQCQNYSRVEESKCLRCQQLYYVSDNLCVEREISLNIEFCQRTYAELDQCEECSTGYLTNQDMSKCIQVISNCLNHQKMMDSLECIDCIDNFYPKNQECVLGSLKGCRKYSNESTCQDCQNGFYKDQNGECKSHELTSQIKCFRFSITSQNYCEQCHETRVKYQTKNLCLEVETLIEHCVEYKDSKSCSICDSSLSFLKDGKCQVGTIANCLVYESSLNKCLICGKDPVTGFGLKPNNNFENNFCVLFNPNVFQNCANIDTNAEKSCSYCTSGYYQKYLDNLNLQWCVPRDFYLLNGRTNTDNCNLYDYQTGQCLRCLKKSNGKFYVIHNGSCLDECPNNFSVLTSEFSNKRVHSHFVCKPLSFFQNQVDFTQHFVSKFGIPCERYEIDPFDNGKIYCASCSENHIALYEQNQSVFGLKYQYLMTTSVNSTFSIYNLISPVKSCLSRQSDLTTSQSGTLPIDILDNPSHEHNFENCRFLEKFQNYEEYYCSSCKHGYTGSVVKSVGGAFVYMIKVCEIMTQCKSDLWIDGLGSIYHPTAVKTQIDPVVPKNFDYFLSCHQCNSKNGKELIPTFAITIDYFSSNVYPDKNYLQHGIGMYGFGTGTAVNDEPTKFDTQKLNQTTCQERGITHQDKFPPNCAVQMLNILYQLQPYTTNANSLPEVKVFLDNQNRPLQYSNPLCMACSPGYRPVLNSSLTNIIDYCEKIENCLSSNTFNQCEVCQTGYMLTELEDKQSCTQDMTKPILENCLIQDSAKQHCSLCKKGYHLNQDKQCDMVSTYQCQQNGFYQAYSVSLTFNINYFKNGVGCELCSDDSILVFFIEQQPNCIRNDLLDKDSILHTSTLSQINEQRIRTVSFFIQNCELYQLSQGSVKCQQCKQNYILQTNYLKCWGKDQFPNCKKTEIGGIQCKECNEGYYFDNSTYQCLEGTIQYCLVYLNKFNCYTCQEGYVNTTIKGNKTVCIQVTELNCQSLDTVQANQGILECKQCKKGFQQIQTGIYGIFPLIQCLPIPQIANCLEYNQSFVSVTKSTLECTRCDKQFYLKNESCQRRTKMELELNCDEFEETLDQCKSCKKGYYLNKVSLLCKMNPSSTQGCISFRNEKDCLKCKKNMYLKNNKCFQVEKHVDKCEFYLNSFECQQCEQNYFLVNQRCEQSYASNCLEQKDLNECSKCKEGWGLSLSGNVKSCSEIQVKACDLPDTSSLGPNFKCLKCSKNHYLDTNTSQCLEQQSQINQCIYYQGVKQCRKCEGLYTLSQDLSNCLNLDYASKFKDSNCGVSQQSYQCALCQPGFVFDSNNECIQCQAGEGCSICDSKNILKCLVCKTNYYHSEKGECVSLVTKTESVEKIVIKLESIWSWGVLTWTAFFLAQQIGNQLSLNVEEKTLNT